MVNAEIKKKYQEHASKFDLPAFKEIEEDFYITSFFAEKKAESTDFLRDLRICMINVFWYWTNGIHGFISPNPQSAILMREYEKFSQEEQIKMMNDMGKLVLLTRKAILLDLVHSDAAEAKWIKESFKEWKKIKPTLKVLFEKSVKNWENI